MVTWGATVARNLSGSWETICISFYGLEGKCILTDFSVLGIRPGSRYLDHCNIIGERKILGDVYVESHSRGSAEDRSRKLG